MVSKIIIETEYFCSYLKTLFFFNCFKSVVYKIMCFTSRKLPVERNKMDSFKLFRVNRLNKHC